MTCLQVYKSIKQLNLINKNKLKLHDTIYQIYTICSLYQIDNFFYNSPFQGVIELLIKYDICYFVRQIKIHVHQIFVVKRTTRIQIFGYRFNCIIGSKVSDNNGKPTMQTYRSGTLILNYKNSRHNLMQRLILISFCEE